LAVELIEDVREYLPTRIRVVRTAGPMRASITLVFPAVLALTGLVAAPAVASSAADATGTAVSVTVDPV